MRIASDSRKTSLPYYINNILCKRKEITWLFYDIRKWISKLLFDQIIIVELTWQSW